jgi:hypothetical protein
VLMFATSSEDASHYECPLDEAPFATCASRADPRR